MEQPEAKATNPDIYDKYYLTRRAQRLRREFDIVIKDYPKIGRREETAELELNARLTIINARIKDINEGLRREGDPDTFEDPTLGDRIFDFLTRHVASRIRIENLKAEQKGGGKEDADHLFITKCLFPKGLCSINEPRPLFLPQKGPITQSGKGGPEKGTHLFIWIFISDQNGLINRCAPFSGPSGPTAKLNRR